MVKLPDVFQFDDEKNKTDTDTGWMPVPEMVTSLDDMYQLQLYFTVKILSVEKHSWRPSAYSIVEPDY